MDFKKRYRGKENGKMALGFKGGLEYLESRFILSSDLKGITYDNKDIPRIQNKIKNENKNWNFHMDKKTQEQYYPKDR